MCCCFRDRKNKELSLCCIPVFFSSFCLLFLLGIAFVGPAEAVEPTPITAEAAFDAVATQTDPVTGAPANVAFVDVRTRAEYFWVGAPARVNAIVLQDNAAIVPDLGKVKIGATGALLRFSVDGDNHILPVSEVSQLNLSPIAINIPFKLWDEATTKLVPNSGFGKDIGPVLASAEVVILFCRSGGRSTACVGDVASDGAFNGYPGAVYEIDDPEGKQGRGGFEGSSYGDAYNGYRGFPGRLTQLQDVSSVSWKDSGLPMKTSLNPFQ